MLHEIVAHADRGGNKEKIKNLFVTVHLKVQDVLINVLKLIFFSRYFDKMNVSS
jgi:hypothetical protein